MKLMTQRPDCPESYYILKPVRLKMTLEKLLKKI